MKYLVLGSTGMAGHVISIYLKESGHDVTTFSRRKFDYCKNIIGDIRDLSLIETIIEEGKYDYIINAIGILNQIAEDNKANAVLLNSFLPHFLVEATKNRKTKIIHISTDCVFSGKDGNYSENSIKDGQTFYDQTKSLGEIDNFKDLTFRNSIIGPDMNKNGIGLFNWFMKQKFDLKGYTKAIWTGVTTLTLAKAIEEVANSNITGIYHLVNNQSITKFDLLDLFNKIYRNNGISITPYNEFSIDKSLINNRTDFNFIVPSYEEMIAEMKRWIVDHSFLYPHYFL